MERAPVGRAARRLLLLTAVGKDRPGIVSGVARVLYERGCNIEDSTMTILCGEFAILLMLSAPPDLALQALEAGFDSVRSDLALHVALREVTEGEVAAGEGEGPEAYVITVTGADHPGIVWRVTELLAASGVNVTDLNSKLLEGTDKPLYMLVLEVVPPGGPAMIEVEAKLSELASAISVEIRVNRLETAPL